MRLYVINLDGSKDRWDGFQEAAEGMDAVITRLSAVDGRTVDRDDWIDVDHKRFMRCHGRTILPGEYGCYRSHLKALDAIIASDDRHAIICEDDIAPHRDMIDIVRTVLTEKPDLHLLKLANHRIQGFIRHGGESEAATFGRCVHGPQGSAAAYAVTKEGAKKLRAALATMWLPYDVAFERGWAMNTRVYTLKNDAVDIVKKRYRSTISSGPKINYRTTKLFWLKRVPTAVFRGIDYLARARYALR
ncbi:MAG: glycosyltransferase family 25 protein [Fulvimarina manganoxydans]|uniref:glycosyltransferase family 25 protein n=1 Tax=Fulvimarina manganoxydans TaxID=937218 RepID=UPI0023540B3E|nr:glycosyltransferase family 25 protein [Fulvimarina manganoxydans]MCK5931182.1 glycosyltransferase family 25 protein [Fulvimarina manganoxydans]